MANGNFFRYIKFQGQEAKKFGTFRKVMSHVKHVRNMKAL
jgi:hypothetical protein